MKRFLFLLGAGVFSAGLQAQGVVKCSDGGQTSYGDRPCAHGRSTLLPPPAGISISDQMGPQGGDARTLLELEKARIAREKAAEKQGRVEVRQARAAQAQRKKCDKLRLRRKWAEEDLVRSAHGPRQEAARIRLRRQLETLAVECPA
ncbi:DUF4124 domain-containing protein [Massilia sp. LXY-6]|uniref:DUF4124 domain-containing protein n=1 Tax=Massilia sp. LXY-6 TaxID=3379823 RepID=UPI003EE354E6